MLSLLFFAFDFSPALIDDGRISDFLQLLPNGYSLEYVLEGTAPGVQLGYEDSLGITKVDPQKISLYGESYAWTRWRWNGIDISDPLFSGAAAFRLPFRMLQSVSTRDGVSLETKTGNSLSVGGMGVTPGFGGIGPGSIELADKYSGTHPLQRTPLPPTARREFAGNYVFSVAGDNYAVEVTQGQRRFIDSGLEPFQLVSGAAQFGPLMIAAEVLHREHMFAQDHFTLNETMPYTSGALFAGIAAEHISAGVTLKLYDFSARGIDFTREQHDWDGESLWPFQPRGQWFGGNFDFNWRPGIPYVQLNHRMLSYFPARSSWSNALTLDGSSTGRVDWQATPLTTSYGSQRAGVSDELALGIVRLKYDAYVMTSFTSRMFVGDVGLRGELRIEAGHGITPFAIIERKPQPLTANVALAIDPPMKADTGYDRPNDIGVQGGLLATKVHTLALGMRWAFAPHWFFVAQGMAKSFDDGYWVQGGQWQRDGDRYFGGGGDYRLTNAPWTQTPFMLGAEGSLVGSDRDHYLFQLGLQTLVSMGASAFGMGSATNDVGVINATMANPNSRLFPQGNLDPDRAYVFKLSVGYRFISTLWAFFTARFRDGQPFAFLTWREKDGQVQATYTTNKGSLYHLTGPRTDAIIVCDLQLSYEVPLPMGALKLTALIANFWDPQTELSEQQPGGDLGNRASFELQLPRMAMFGVELRL